MKNINTGLNINKLSGDTNSIETNGSISATTYYSNGVDINDNVVFQSGSTSDHGQNFASHTFTASSGYLYKVTFGQRATYDNETDTFTSIIKVGGGLVNQSVAGDRANIYNDYDEVTYLLIGDNTSKTVSFETTYSGGVVFNYSFALIERLKL